MSTPRKGRGHHYEPLESPNSQIRLLTLDPDDDRWILCFNMKSFELNTCPPYVALSYEWGEVEPQVEIMVNGQCLLIRHNLSLFLSVIKAKQRLKPNRGELRLWIDAICINQEDLSERNFQVSIMGRIYRDASSVFAWLDWPHGWDPRRTFDFINIFSRNFSASLKVYSSRYDSMEPQIFWELGYGEMWRMVLKMCRCRYWSRRWILQELLLAQQVTIMCGKNDLSWITFKTFVKQLVAIRGLQKASNFQDLSTTIPFIMSSYADENKEKGLLTMHQLVVMFAGTDCEVLHDKVYSLRSLARDGNLVAVDYGCSLQSLLYRLITQNSWSHAEVRLLAQELNLNKSIPGGSRALEDSEESQPSPIDDTFVVTHQAICCIPMKLTESYLEVWKTIMKAGSPEPCPGIVEALDFLSFLDLRSEYGRERSRYHELEGKESDQEVLCEKTLEFDCIYTTRTAPRPRFVICSDGSMGLASPTARVGDLLCDFIPGRKLVVRQKLAKPTRFVGTAMLLDPSPTVGFVLLHLERIAALVLREKMDYMLYKLACRANISIIDDVSDLLLQIKKESHI